MTGIVVFYSHILDVFMLVESDAWYLDIATYDPNSWVYLGEL